MKKKVLNLYSCLGGNRFKWDEVTDIEVTAIELDPELARMYQERFPNFLNNPLKFLTILNLFC